MISMRLAFGTVGSHLFRRFHTDQLKFATYERVSYLFLTNHPPLGKFFTSIALAAPCFSRARAFGSGRETTSSFLNGP